mgnify:CR=1 FL=1
MSEIFTSIEPSFLLLILFFVLIYFLMIRPENKRRKEHEKMVTAIEVGDEIVSSGGLLGKVTKTSDQFFELNLSDNVKVKIQRTAVSNVLPKGTINSI